MSEIPEDVRRAADAVFDVGYDEGIVDAIARAILAERQRCADVAEARAEWVPLKAGDMRAAIEAGA